MILDTNEHNLIRLKEVFEPIELVTASGQFLTVCMRDNGFEIATGDSVEIATGGSLYTIVNGDLVKMGVEDNTDHQTWIAIPLAAFYRLVDELQAAYKPSVEYSTDHEDNANRAIGHMKMGIRRALERLKAISPDVNLPN